MLRLFGASADTVRCAAKALPNVTAQCASRGGETLVALRADTSAALQKAEKRLRARYPDALYGKGDQTLASATVQALERHDLPLAAADAAANALLESRLESVEGASRVFDFGALSCANAAVQARIENFAQQQASRRRAPASHEDAALELGRVRAVLRFVGAEIAAGCVPQSGGMLLFAGTRKGCWLRFARAEENPALWLLDMVRRIACGLKQANGTCWQRYRAKLCLPDTGIGSMPTVCAANTTTAVPASAPASAQAAALTAAPPRAKHWVRRTLAALFLLALLGLGAAWYATGGDLTTLPQTLGLPTHPHSGAVLV